MQKLALSIGDLQLANPLILAPMAGITDLPYRLIHKRFGAALVTTEMVSAAGLAQNGGKTFDLLDSRAEERPLSIQLFGQDPVRLAEAAKRVEAYGDCIDINMGCPVKKVVKGGAGCALMRSPAHIGAIIASVRQALSKPLTVKFRSGWDNAHLNYLEVGQIAQDEGADAITLHPRTRAQMFSGTAHWEHIKRLVDHVTIPVIGSGDIFCADDGLKMFKDTGCAGLMIGRGGYGNPWLFQQLLAALAGRPVTQPSLQERLQIGLLHADLAQTYLAAHKAMLEMRKHLCWYTRGLPGAGAFRASLQHLGSLEDMRAALTHFFNHVEREDRPL